MANARRHSHGDQYSKVDAGSEFDKKHGHGLVTGEHAQNFMSIGHFRVCDAKVTLTD